MATVALLGSVTWNSTGGNTTVTASPTLGDLIVVIAASSGLAGGTTAVTDNQAGADASTYTQIDVDYTGFSTTGVLTAWIRNKLITSNASTVFTAAQATSTGGGLAVLRVTSMSIVGLGAVRGCGGQSSGGAGTTPAPVLLRRLGTTFSGTQAALTENPVISASCDGATAASYTVRSSPAYTEDFDNGYSLPSTGLCVSHINSGETASTITWGATVATTWAVIAFELDASVPVYDYVVANRRADLSKMATQIASTVRSNVY